VYPPTKTSAPRLELIEAVAEVSHARGRLLITTIIFIILAPTALVAQSVKVLVLDALSGKPQQGVTVYSFCQSDTHNFLPPDEDVTESDGIAIVSYPCKPDQKIEFFVTALPKEECGGEEAVSFREILEVGIISPPDDVGQMHCQTKISRKLKPVPGQVTIFIKKPSWMQSHF
jgi:hypothetical protein